MNSTPNGTVRARRSAERPVIGVCARTAPVTLQGAPMTVSLALQSHVDFLAAAGCAPLLLPLLPGVEHPVDHLDGLLVPGGPDLDPALYGAAPHPRTRGANPAVDTAELALVAAALDAGLPVLAICRGMQLLNVRFGGTLHQHLPEVTGHDGHCPETEKFTFGGNRLDLRPGSRIAEILGDGPSEAACHHHQAIDRIGTGLTATAWAPDGVVEVVEVTGHPFAIGVQWEAGQTEDERLHRALAEAAGRSAAQAAGRRAVDGSGPVRPATTRG
ncbi:gamma-glutamyl-gamma-aminobutyrate hydrolase family protein [Actinoallomurus spadix]|uniref:Gamma-glutamyl-gamma-aminobutyrate hydrolase family protein n=1 Tax=Actinoallomurus spadix TaxID=79912 RepID=A0ABN0X8Y3_9ACTN|nr:gamma-glutamyl-gamma-aminobutyrate hydrolase family protein [Actinoallomurus spadix]MCO5984500.1 gamma-glutamyl-gamma-aminobutyrate hydrolase family protein [Actinoallomurus spadix]